MKPTTRVRKPPPSPLCSLSQLLHKGKGKSSRATGALPLFTPSHEAAPPSPPVHKVVDQS